MWIQISDYHSYKWAKGRPVLPSGNRLRYLSGELAAGSSSLRVRRICQDLERKATRLRERRGRLLEGKRSVRSSTPGGTAGPSRLHVRGTGQILKSVPSVSPRRPRSRQRVRWRSWIWKSGRSWMCGRCCLVLLLEGWLSIMRQEIRNVGEPHPLSRGLRYFANPSPILASGVEAQANAAHLVHHLPLNLSQRQPCNNETIVSSVTTRSVNFTSYHSPLRVAPHPHGGGKHR